MPHRLSLLAVLCAMHATHAVGGNRVWDPLQSNTAPSSSDADDATPTLLPAPALAHHHQVAPMLMGGGGGGVATQPQAEEGRLPISDAMRQQLPPPDLYGPG